MEHWHHVQFRMHFVEKGEFFIYHTPKSQFLSLSFHLSAAFFQGTSEESHVTLMSGRNKNTKKHVNMYRDIREKEDKEIDRERERE